MRISFKTLNASSILVAVAAVSVLSACGAAQAAQTFSGNNSATLPPVTTVLVTTLPVATTPSGPIDAAAIFSNQCAKCQETNEVAPSVSGESDSDIVKFLAGHNTGGSLSAAQRTAIATFLKASCADDG